MNKRTIGNELKLELAKGYDIVRIARWASRLFFEHMRSLDSFSTDVLEKISVMEDATEFELTADELRSLADRLIAEGDKEELAQPINEIEEIAQELGDSWLMCPVCQEAWEDHSKYAMVCCPKCSNIFHNPKFKPSSKEMVEKAISLEKYGINEFAWSKENALRLINSIMADGVGIFGGDVYKLTSHRLEPLYDNWRCESRQNETQAEFYLRSKIESLKYIEKYPVHPDERIVFSITFTEQIV